MSSDKRKYIYYFNSQWTFVLGVYGIWIVKLFHVSLIMPILNNLFTQSNFPAATASIINNSIKTTFNAGLPGKSLNQNDLL